MPSFVQIVGPTDPGFVTTANITVTSTTAGNAICAVIKNGNNGDPTSVTCGGSDSLSLVDSFTDSDGNRMSVWEKLDIVGGSTTLSVTWSGGTFGIAIGFAELSSVDSAGPILNATGTGADVTESFTTTVDAAAAFGIITQDVVAYTLTGDAGYTVTPGSAAFQHLMYDADVGSAGSKDFGATWGGGPAWELIGRVYYPASGGGGGNSIAWIRA